jgi:uncharacterized membrane protein YoaK (UPF0700 family)
MSQVKQFTVGGVTYNAAMASAVDQDKVLSLLTASIIERAFEAARKGIELDANLLTAMFMSMQPQIKSQVSAALMGEVFVHGNTTNVSVLDFSGKMVRYNELLTKLLQWNLSDFFDWLPSALGVEEAAQESPAQ